MRKILLVIPTLLFFTILITACSTAKGNNPAGTAESYINALVAKDSTTLSKLSCAEWESQALTELDSFQAVTTTVKDLSCKQTGTDGNTTLVSCSGKILASYNGEAQELDLSTRVYQMTKNGDTWLVCGVQ